MKIQLHAIVDAAGNIYPGTFSKTEDSAIAIRCFQIFGSHIRESSVETIQRTWDERVANGDRAVLCDIETNESVSVKLVHA